MINNDYISDINPDNPLGASNLLLYFISLIIYLIDGYLAVKYADMLREMWQGNDSHV